jgi:DNA-binding LytR/AlgR family response regulator
MNRNTNKVGEFFYTSFMLNKLKCIESVDIKTPSKILIKYSDIISLTTYNQPKNWICISSFSERKVYKETSLENFVKQLPIEGFVKISRDMCVNLFHITGIGKNSLFIGEKSFKVSRTYNKKVFELLKNYCLNP